MGSHGFYCHLDGLSDLKAETECKHGQPLWAAMVSIVTEMGYLIFGQN